jgi:hypothetical protein
MLAQFIRRNGVARDEFGVKIAVTLPTRSRNLVEKPIQKDIADYLTDHGFQVTREFKLPTGGKIDIIAEKPGTYLVIEVKASISTPTPMSRACTQLRDYLTYLPKKAKPVAVVVAGEIDYMKTQGAINSNRDVMVFTADGFRAFVKSQYV